MPHIVARKSWLLAVCLALSVQPVWGAGADSPTERHTQFGVVVGTDDSATSGTYAWKGVPFAKPPVGELRWKAPVDPEPWAEPRATQEFGNACVQYGRIYGPGANNTYDETIGTTLNTAVGSEDCLYLNIWRPATLQGGLPVIVFVHGGSNVSGYTADPVYDGAALAKSTNSVVVTVNYRLGIFGFLDVPQLKSGDPIEDSGNFALLDIVKALKFVHRNIELFGGNPANVTLMGQSAGAINVYAMLTSPLVRDPKLFHRAVPMSGGISLATELPHGSIPTLNPESVALAQGKALLANQLLADGFDPQTYLATHTSAEVAQYLRSKSPAALLFTLLTKLALLGLTGSGPIPDGTVLPIDPVAAIGAGDYLRVPVLVGNTRDEAKLFPTFLALLFGVSGRIPTDAQLFSIQFTYDPDTTSPILIGQWIPSFYLPVDKGLIFPVTIQTGEGFNAATDLLNSIFFIPSRDNVLTALKSQQSDVWYYRFDWDEEPAPFNDIYGAAHAFDLAFVFGNFGPSLFANVEFSTANRPGRLELSDAMMQSLGAFARAGDPNTPALGVTWPVWPAMLKFDATPTEKAISVE